MLRRVTNRLACLMAGACLTASLLPLASAQEEKRANRRAERAEAGRSRSETRR